MKNLENCKVLLEFLTKSLKNIGCSQDVAGFIIAQILLETGNFQSKIVVENNNLFGMKKPSKRISFAVGVNRGHAVYLTLTDSLLDYILWLVFFGFTQKDLQDVDNFKQKLAISPYSECSDYITRIEKIYCQIKP